MLSILQTLETLQADLARIDPAREIDAAERIADLAVALRQALANPVASGSATPVQHLAARASA